MSNSILNEPIKGGSTGNILASIFRQIVKRLDVIEIMDLLIDERSDKSKTDGAVRIGIKSDDMSMRILMSNLITVLGVTKMKFTVEVEVAGKTVRGSVSPVIKRKKDEPLDEKNILEALEKLKGRNHETK